MDSQMAIIIMIVGGLLALWGLKLKKSNKGLGVAVSVIFSLVTLGCAGQRLWQELNRDSLFLAKTMRVTEARGEVLGSHISSAFPDARVLILKSPDFPGIVGMHKTEDKVLEGIMQGIKAGQVAGEYHLPIPEEVLSKYNEGSSDEAGDMMMYELFEVDSWYTAEVLDSFLQKHEGEYDLLLTLSSLPTNLDESEILHSEKAPKVVCGGASNIDIDEYIRKGLIVATISSKLGEKGPAIADVKLPESSQEIFNLWYEIITPKNVSPAVQPTPVAEEAAAAG